MVTVSPGWQQQNRGGESGREGGRVGDGMLVVVVLGMERFKCVRNDNGRVMDGMMAVAVFGMVC